jgi:hypothetical protein
VSEPGKIVYKTEDDAGELASIALHLGYVMGGLQRPQTVAALTSRGVSRSDIGNAKASLGKIAEAFYRKGVD